MHWLHCSVVAVNPRTSDPLKVAEASCDLWCWPASFDDQTYEASAVMGGAVLKWLAFSCSEVPAIVFCWQCSQHRTSPAYGRPFPAKLLSNGLGDKSASSYEAVGCRLSAHALLRRSIGNSVASLPLKTLKKQTDTKPVKLSLG